MTKPVPRPGILDIAPYVPGRSAASAGGPVYKLSSNESALGPAPSAIAALGEMAEKAHLYPDGAAKALKGKLGALNGMGPERIVVGNGSDELLSMMVRAYASPGDEVLMTRHGFSYYPLAAMAEGAVPVMAEERDYTADVDALLAAAGPKTKVLFLANPNNPTGTRLPQEELKRLREGLPPHVMLVLDGAYAEYVDAEDYDAGRSLIEDATATGADNVVMTRTFSKIYGLGGLRVGWLYGPPGVADVLNRLRGPFNTNALGLAAAAAALSDQDFVETNRRHNQAEMARMAELLEEAGYHLRTTEANFLLLAFDSEREARSFLEHQEKAGVFVRGLASSHMPTFVRVSIGSREANDAFLTAAMAFKTANE
ncbi:MAG: histidinol-phosphate transaminase, partial [Parvularcula sp.]|nr:histidinol-phosphate transaminase [Parvularcula sp.]